MTREAMKAMGVKVLEQEPCNDAAKERYEDLCEYFGEAKDILTNREDFKAWLGRVKWHIHKAEELSAENDDLRDQLAMRDFREKPKTDVLDKIRGYVNHIRNTGMGKKKSLEFIEKFIEGLKAESEDKDGLEV